MPMTGTDITGSMFCACATRSCALVEPSHRMIFSYKNDTWTPKLIRIYEFRTGFIWSSTYTDQCGTWLFGAERNDTSVLTDQGPYEFSVSGTGYAHIDLANTYLFVEAQIVNDSYTVLVGGADVGPVNLWVNSLFSDVSVNLNEKLVSPPTSLYPNRAYIETLLSYGPAAIESQLTGVKWYNDTPGHQDKRTTDHKGFTIWKALTAQSKSVQIMGKLHFDLVFKRNIYWITSIGKSNYDEIETLAVRMGHIKALEKTSCKYPIRRVEIKVDTVPVATWFRYRTTCFWANYQRN